MLNTLHLRSALVVGASAVALSSVASPAWSQNVIQELVVTAQKREEALQDVPIAVSAFNQDTLEKAKIDGGPNLVIAVPNVNFSKGNFTGYNFQIRGIGSKLVAGSGDAGTGIHLNNAPLLSNNLFETEFYDVERVEVLRGPQGTLYGRNATGGVVNMITAKPIDEFEAMIRGEGLARPIAATGLFPAAGRQMIRVGESTGSLDEQLQTAAVFYERELEYRLKRVTDLFEPTVIILVGGAVAFVALAQVSAMYSIYSQVGKKDEVSSKPAVTSSAPPSSSSGTGAGNPRSGAQPGRQQQP